MKNKTKKADQKKLYNLLSDAEVISDGERMFWLENFSMLGVDAQQHLSEIIKNGERELTREKDAHMNRVAEIDTKCLAELQEFARAKKLKASNNSNRGDDENLDYDEDEILKTLHQAGEI